MPTYSYKAVGPSGDLLHGTLTSSNLQALRLLLAARQQKLIGAKRQSVLGRRSLSHKRKGRDLINFCLHMGHMDRAKVGVLESLETAKKMACNAPLKNAITHAYEQIKGGHALSQAFGQHPKIFDPFFVGVIAAAEQTGDFSRGFEKLVKHLKWVMASRDQAQKSIRHPLFLLALVGGVISILVSFVLPQLKGFFTGLGIQLPTSTRFLFMMTDFLVVYWWAGCGAIVGFWSICLGARNLSVHIRHFQDHVILKTPFLGVVWKKIALMRYLHFFTLSFQSGLDMLKSLQIAKGVVENRFLSHRLESVGKKIEGGYSLSEALSMTSFFEEATIHLIRVGETSGTLVDILETVIEYLEKDISQRVDLLLEMIEPCLLVLIGGLMLWCVVGVFLPIYENLMRIG